MNLLSLLMSAHFFCCRAVCWSKYHADSQEDKFVVISRWQQGKTESQLPVVEIEVWQDSVLYCPESLWYPHLVHSVVCRKDVLNGDLWSWMILCVWHLLSASHRVFFKLMFFITQEHFTMDICWNERCFVSIKKTVQKFVKGWYIFLRKRSSLFYSEQTSKKV